MTEQQKCDVKMEQDFGINMCRCTKFSELAGKHVYFSLSYSCCNLGRLLMLQACSELSHLDDESVHYPSTCFH